MKNSIREGIWEAGQTKKFIIKSLDPWEAYWGDINGNWSEHTGFGRESIEIYINHSWYYLGGFKSDNFNNLYAKLTS